MRSQRIRTSADQSTNDVKIGGWLNGKQTYLRVEIDRRVAIISGQSLYRLAKAIVRQFDGDKK